MHHVKALRAQPGRLHRLEISHHRKAPESHGQCEDCLLQASGEPTVVSKAETARRQALSEGDLKGAAAAEVSLLTAVLEAQFGQAHVEAEQGLITMQVS